MPPASQPPPTARVLAGQTAVSVTTAPTPVTGLLAAGTLITLPGFLPWLIPSADGAQRATKSSPNAPSDQLKRRPRTRPSVTPGTGRALERLHQDHQADRRPWSPLPGVDPDVDPGPGTLALGTAGQK